MHSITEFFHLKKDSTTDACFQGLQLDFQWNKQDNLNSETPDKFFFHVRNSFKKSFENL